MESSPKNFKATNGGPSMPTNMQKVPSKVQKKRNPKSTNMFDVLLEEVSNPFSSVSGGEVTSKENVNPNLPRADRNLPDNVETGQDPPVKQDKAGWMQVVYKKKLPNPLPSSSRSSHLVTHNLDLDTFAQDLYKSDQVMLTKYSSQAFNQEDTDMVNTDDMEIGNANPKRKDPLRESVSMTKATKNSRYEDA
ncbi:hypothetical protein KP509_05G073900 [Ceratopteris richardii]|uniref:Uncharacterized protein n=1 Tax=Ceratopteris richardii TaxID=49495 RepID=A0A8T2UQ11_CERRI|nr:hypothetical protein KP509_05G073900 [Ceratopteris richardii]